MRGGDVKQEGNQRARDDGVPLRLIAGASGE